MIKFFSKSVFKFHFLLVLVIIGTLLMSIAQLFYKIGVGQQYVLKMYFLILVGLAFYGVSAVILIMALRKGNLSSIYPSIAVSYIWVSLLSFLFLNEVISSLKAFGISMIVLGIWCIGTQYQNREGVE